MIRYIRKLRLFAIAALLIGSAQLAKADFVFNVGTGINTTYSVGDTIRVPFTISTGGDNLAGYAIAVDFGNTNGYGGTSSFSNIYADFASKQLGDFSGIDDGKDPDGNGPLGFFNIDLAEVLDGAGAPFAGNISFDYLVGNSQQSNVSGNIRLFELVFMVEDGASGMYHVNAVIRTDLNDAIGYSDQTKLNYLSGQSVLQHDLNSVSAVNFSFTITAVPEPSSLMLALLGSCLLMVRRRVSC